MTEKSPDRADTLNQTEASTMDSTAADFDDSGSDISMSDGTEDDETEAPPIISSASSRKRRHSAEGGELNGHNGEIFSKRLKPDPALASQYAASGHLKEDRSLLPAEIWHNIFTFTPPRMLGSLLRVNKIFNSYLDPSSTVNKPAIEPLSTSVAKFLDPDSIWQASRVLFRPGMPTPLAGFSELDMWKLVCQKSCQFCHTKSAHDAFSRDPWHSGPGEKGVRIIWSFAIRSCASCLLKNCMKETDLLLSSSEPSLVIPALPFVFLTSDNHIVSHAALQNGIPPNVQLTKYFYKPHIEDMKVEFFKAKEMGTAAAEEWIKGLDDLGKDRRNDAIRWERWEAVGGLQRMHATEPGERAPVVLPNKPQVSMWHPQTAANSMTFGLNPFQQNGRPASAGQALPIAIQVPHSMQAPQNMAAPFSTVNPPRFNSPATNGFGLPPRAATHQRTKEEAAEMKAARKAEIERRAMLLDPPLSAAVLAHMSSFQAALQIIKPLDDNAWELLKPRLLSQRPEAEQREKERELQTRVLQDVVDERRQLPYDQQTKEVDKEWDEVQAPLRTRICGFADEIIRDGWADGRKITHDNSPQFAAEVLIYVRKRFYAEIAKDDAAARAAGQQPKVDPPNGPFTRKLILDNMKWVFDYKIKPHTEKHRKELFLCNSCENNSKLYGFEGVIQHYAAKHTHSLSLGSVVVYWRAEWPEKPPFYPDPTQAKGSSSHGRSEHPPHSSYGWNGYPASSAPMPIQSTSSQMYPPNPAYGQSNFGEPYAGLQNGFQPSNHAIQGPQYPGNTQAYQSHPPQPFDQTGPRNSFSNPTGNYAPPAVPADPRAPSYQGGTTFPPGLPNPATQQTSQTQEYRTQLEFVASTAREIWNSTTGIKEMPGSVRVYVIIHQVINRSRAQFPREPPLSMFIDGLSNNKEMRPVRNVNSLVCKTCNSDPSRAIPGERTSFSLPQLFNHFQTHHTASHPDLYWVNDMVQLPEMSKVSALLYQRGMDDHKLKLIADIFPMAFPSPLPRVEAARAAITESESFHRNNKFGDRAEYRRENRGRHYGYEAEPVGSQLAENTATNYGNFGQASYDDRKASFSEPRNQKEDVSYIPRQHQDGRPHAETAPAYTQPDGSEIRGTAVYNHRTAGQYAQNQRADEVMQERNSGFVSESSYSRPANSHTSPEGSMSHPQLKQMRRRESPLPNSDGRDLLPVENAEKLAKEAEEHERLQEEALRASWKAERIDSMRRMYQPTTVGQRGDRYDEGDDFSYEQEAVGASRPKSPERLPATRTSQPVQDRQPSQRRQETAYEYDDRPTYANSGSQYNRERSPELVDHRYKRNNVVYRDERQPSQPPSRGMAPGRYARYESARLENDRDRSRSPVYVKVGSQPGPYRERSPVLHPPQPEPIYQGQTPPGNAHQMAYERVPRTEYYYADEPRTRQPPAHLIEEEFIRVADPAGDYMIRRPPQLRREPVYAQYEEDPYLRQPVYDSREPLYEAREPLYEPRNPLAEGREPVYESRAPVSRSDPAYYEEYDPRNPAPPPPTALRQPRYQ